MKSVSFTVGERRALVHFASARGSRDLTWSLSCACDCIQGGLGWADWHW